jgi:hypothetical protein
MGAPIDHTPLGEQDSGFECDEFSNTSTVVHWESILILKNQHLTPGFHMAPVANQKHHSTAF